MVNKILIIIGTRPEAIKMAPVILKLKKKFNVKICLSGQHNNLLTEAIKIFNIKPNFNIKVMTENQTLFDISSRILLRINNVLDNFKPDLILVHGDTTTSSISALAGFYKKIQIGHVEAGLRTNDLYSPFPEEMNRQLTARIAQFHFAPSKLAKKNLIKENIKASKIYVTGNTVVDALEIILKKAKKTPFPREIIKKYPLINSIKNQSKIIVVTCHRRENFGKGISDLCKALIDLTKIYRDIKIIYILHPNPNIKKKVSYYLSNLDNIYILPPQNYLTFVKIMYISDLIISDSGGIQEEAPSINKPVLVIRKNTERPEGLQSGLLKIIGSERKNIVTEAKKALGKKNKMRIISNPYGDGKAADKILKIISTLKK